MKPRVLLRDAADGRWLRFGEPLEIVQAFRTDEVLDALRRVESLVEEGHLYAAGFLAYESAPAFDRALKVREHGPFPLLWFALCSEPERTELPPSSGEPGTAAWEPTVSRGEYDAAIARIKSHIAEGDTYQVNFTYRLRARFSGDSWDFFRAMVDAQAADYPAYIDTGRFVISSASPELFFHRDGPRLTCKPMKGTAPRGRFPDEDNAQAHGLQASEKNRAENVMIVDMIRNDLGRVAEIGSVRTTEVFSVERYPTVWQMTSTVRARTGAGLPDVFAALFPCASVTGAPKARTMEIIADLETTPRGIYTGCLGFVAPGRRAQFSVAIRTAVIDRSTGSAEYGVGGGILWDSDAADEYRECGVKALVLTERRPPFSLLETILWTQDEDYFLLSYHLRRLQDSAAYFAIPLNMGVVRSALAGCTPSFGGSPHRVRLLVGPDGSPSCETSPYSGPPGAPQGIVLAAGPVDSGDIFLYHKTTHRGVYDRARAARPGADDVLLWNERGEITETTLANIVMRIDDGLFTPPVSSGLLPGTFRARLLEEGTIRERTITVDMLAGCTDLFVVNSLRKWQKAVLLQTPALTASPKSGRELPTIVQS